MRNTARSGNAFHAFKKREAFIIRKLDSRKPTTTRHDNDRQDIPRHNDINAAGRCWTF